MATINISLPDNMREYVEARISEGVYHNLSEYFRDLIRFDQKKRTQEKLEALLVAGLEGKRIRVTPEYVQETLASLLAEHETKANKNA